MKYRAFCRHVWTEDRDWPEGYRPHTVPIDKCRTLAWFDTITEVRQYCDRKNKVWHRSRARIDAGRGTSKDRRIYYTAPRYEFETIG